SREKRIGLPPADDAAHLLHQRQGAGNAIGERLDGDFGASMTCRAASYSTHAWAGRHLKRPVDDRWWTGSCEPRARSSRPTHAAARASCVAFREARAEMAPVAPTEDRLDVTRSQFRDAVTAALGGHAAETVVFGEASTGAGADIERATRIVRRMVTEFGMSERLGPVAFGRKQQMIFLGRDIGEQRDYSERVG